MMRLPAVRTPTHPGELLLEEFIRPLGLLADEIAMMNQIPLSELEGLFRGRRSLGSTEATRLSEYLSTSIGFWMNLQRRYDQYNRAES